MSADSGQRMSQKMRAPALNVAYKCPNKECGNEDVLDAYRGPPTCMGGRGTDRHLPEFMKPQRLVDPIFPL